MGISTLYLDDKKRIHRLRPDRLSSRVSGQLGKSSAIVRLISAFKELDAPDSNRNTNTFSSQSASKHLL